MKFTRQARDFGRYVWSHRLWSSEGCSFVPDFDFKDCCDTHDKETVTHRDAQTGKPISFTESAAKFYWCIALHKPEAHPEIAWVYWSWVCALGWFAWWYYHEPQP